MLPTELIYVLAALGVGVVLYRYFSGHGGVRVSHQELGSLPPEGEIPVRAASFAGAPLRMAPSSRGGRSRVARSSP